MPEAHTFLHCAFPLSTPLLSLAICFFSTLLPVYLFNTMGGQWVLVTGRMTASGDVLFLHFLLICLAICLHIHQWD